MKFYIIFYALFAFIALTVLSTDLLSFYREPAIYVNLYGIGKSSMHWQFKSTINYQLWLGGLVVIFIYCGIVFIQHLFSKNSRKGSIHLYMALIIITIAMLWEVWSMIIWYKSGFDHYPGFDPYLL